MCGHLSAAFVMCINRDHMGHSNLKYSPIYFEKIVWIEIGNFD